MTWLIRKIDDINPWLKLAEQPDLTQAIENPPLWAIRLFIPSAKDNGSLSLYEVKDEAGAKIVAGAWGFTLGDIDKSGTKISFIAAERRLIEEAGFDIEDTPGGLHHECDESHRGISPSDLYQASKLAGIFIAGELFDFAGKTVQQSATFEAQAARFDFPPIARKGSQVTAARNILKLVGNDTIVIQGI